MRARKHLRPETFPFLAVLLCAMGSLILLLLVMDRRAKAVSRAKALQALHRAAEEEGRAQAERQAEWERRCRALHASLLSQEEEVRGQAQAVRDRMAAAVARVQAEEARGGDLRKALQAEQARLAGGEQELAAGRARVAEAERRSAAARAELAVLSGNLRQLELTLAELKAARQREQKTYSVVPYRGKRGENRRPLYVECTVTGLVFHPDKQALDGAEFTPTAVRAQVEQRIARQREAQKTAGTPPDKPAYLLFLVRPEGIASYYRTLAALRALDVEFGYEFIDRDWLLDFPADGDLPAPQAWRMADSKLPPPPAAGGAAGRAPRGVPSGPAREWVAPEGRSNGEAGSPVTGGKGGAPGGLSGPGPAVGIGAPAATAGFGPPGAAGDGSAGKAGVPGGLPGTGSAGGSGPAVATAGFGGPGARGGGLASGPGPASGGSVVGRISDPSGGGGRVGGPSYGQASSTPTRGSSSVPPAPFGSMSGGGDRGPGGFGPGSGGPGAGERPGLGDAGGSGAAPGTATSAFGPSATPATGDGPSASASGRAGSLGFQPGGGGDNPGPAPAGPAANASPGSPGGGTSAPGAGPGSAAAAPGASDTAGGQPSASAARPGGAAAPSANGPPAGRGAGGGGDAGSEPGDVPGYRPADRWPNLGLPPDRTERRATPPPRRLVGNRDWTILVECTADALVLYPGGKRFPVQGLAQEVAGARALVQTVRDMIARRQAMVRPGEPPYRPQLRFLVRPDGLRTFYEGYPVLEAVQVPMTRQNLAADEEIR
jgi:hypothetical protein